MFFRLNFNPHLAATVSSGQTQETVPGKSFLLKIYFSFPGEISSKVRTFPATHDLDS